MEKLVAVGIFFTLAAYLSPSEGYICLTCTGSNERECLLNGFLDDCPIDEVCSTTVRRNQFAYQITKRCKQREACLNEQNQNWNSMNSNERTCNRNQVKSTCRCCCFSDRCNRNERCSSSLQDAANCPRLVEPFINGRRRCSKSNRVGSVCRYSCSANYQVNPSYSAELTCLPNGKWDKPVPCCSEPCPPNFFVDLIILRYYKDLRQYEFATRFYRANFLNLINVGPNSLRVAFIDYDEVVQMPSFGLRESAENVTSEELRERNIGQNISDNTNHSIVNTGLALQHVHENEFNSEYDRPGARNVILSFTDAIPHDDVATPSKLLRDSGVTIFSYFVQTDVADEYNETKLREMSGFHDRRRILTVDRFALNELFFYNYCPGNCRKQN